MPKKAKRIRGHCPKCGMKMEKRPFKIIRKMSPDEKEISGAVYVCTDGCKGFFVPTSIFGVH